MFYTVTVFRNHTKIIRRFRGDKFVKIAKVMHTLQKIGYVRSFEYRYLA